MKKKWLVIPSLLLLALFAVFAATRRPGITVDGAMRAQTIDALVTGLNRYYVFPDKAKQVEKLLRERQKDGAYDGIASGTEFAARLDADVASVTHDLHMRVRFSPDPLPPQPPLPSISRLAALEAPREDGNGFMRWIDRVRRSMQTFGVEKAVRMSPNIGYLKISGFPPPYLTAEKYAAAMNKLADTDALIIDMRDNRGGTPLSVALLISYFVDQRTRLNDIWERASGETLQLWTQDKLDGKRYGGRKPVLILAGPRTASAGEDFTYTMQALKRATVIGERTWGGAHPTMPWRLGDHFSASIPGARSISPITHGNWEGSGVLPDVPAAPSEALEVAKGLLQRQGRIAAVP
ncbi:S41 family peptidase [Massilia norwichensis]|uniref:S41 family peptidase n=1 Tax=Massilia norwichensis TaxID=1442366 RepID=A0ABT2A0G8_9BURK|nr:S41 family peptidase [Massilia norwichensis]MCS0587681.1 S41 family peptidase [Massilia norwichensis]